MAISIHTPRVNNNDDYVRFSNIFADPGTAVRKGDPIAEIETDKATFTVEAEQDGYILGFSSAVGDMVAIGSVFLWMGDSPDEAIPVETKSEAAGPAAEPTLKAAMLLARFGLRASDIPSAGQRLAASDVLEYIQQHKIEARSEAGRTQVEIAPEPVPELPPGTVEPLSVAERGMVRTVAWHRDYAVPGYVEIAYSLNPWQQYADEFQERHKTLMSPFLPLMAFRLVQLAIESPRLNSTITGDSRYAYETVNLGFTVQSGAGLYMLSIRSAERMAQKEFVDALLRATRQAMKGKVTPEAVTGATIAFTSMSRWEVTRHMPILPPYTSLIVAHSHSADKSSASLGASYDHRVLTGGEVALVLRALSRPPEEG